MGHFRGACGNCKWRDHSARCNASTIGDVSDGVDAEGSKESDEDPVQNGDDGPSQ
jgi:hypothetical protein